MPTPLTFTTLEWADNQQPRYLQLYEHIRRAILNGQLKAGEQLPPSRTLARQLSVSRTTVMQAYEALAAEGCDFLDVSGGGNSLVRPPLSPGYQAGYAAQIKAASGLPTMAVGMIRDPRLAERLVASGEVDMIAMARGILYEPRWPWRAAFELGAGTAYAPQYGRADPTKWIQAFPEAEAKAAE